MSKHQLAALLATAVSLVRGASRCIILLVLVPGNVVSSNANTRPIVALAHVQAAGWWGDLKRRRIEGGKRELLLSWNKHTFKLRSPLAYAR